MYLHTILKWLKEVFAKLGYKEWVLPVLSAAIKWVLPVISAAIKWLKKDLGPFLMAVLHAVNKPLQEKPYTALFTAFLIFVGPWVLFIPLFILQALFFIILQAVGFGVSGITGGSLAASYQSFCFGAHTPANSVFAMLQSLGTHYNVGTVSNPFLVFIRLIAGAVGLYVLFWIILV